MKIEAHKNPHGDTLVTVSDREQDWSDLCVGIPKGDKGEKAKAVQAEVETHIGRELMPGEAKSLASAISDAKVESEAKPKKEPVEVPVAEEVEATVDLPPAKPKAKAKAAPKKKGR